jgi:hypothetical protein
VGLCLQVLNIVQFVTTIVTLGTVALDCGGMTGTVVLVQLTGTWAGIVQFWTLVQVGT